MISDTFFVTPADELEKIDDWKYPLAFQAAHHHETLDTTESGDVEWRLRDRVRQSNSHHIEHQSTSSILDENSECCTCDVLAYWRRSA
jgi:hypothetical protein